MGFLCWWWVDIHVSCLSPWAFSVSTVALTRSEESESLILRLLHPCFDSLRGGLFDSWQIRMTYRKRWEWMIWLVPCEPLFCSLFRDLSVAYLWSGRPSFIANISLSIELFDLSTYRSLDKIQNRPVSVSILTYHHSTWAQDGIACHLVGFLNLSVFTPWCTYSATLPPTRRNIIWISS